MQNTRMLDQGGSDMVKLHGVVGMESEKRAEENY